MKDGIYYDLTIDQYLAEPGIRSGELSLAADALRRWKYQQDNPDEEGTTWAAFGSALHFRVLEPAKFTFCVAVFPKLDKRTKSGKEAYHQFISDNAGKLIIDQEEADIIESMANAVSGSAAAQKVLAGVKTEVSVFWHDQQTGERCKCRLDGWNEKTGIITELKGVRSAKYHQFSNQVCECGWHRQAAHQAAGLKAHGLKPLHHVFIAVEKEAPHLLTVTELDPAYVELAERSNAAVLKRISAAKQFNVFPGYDDAITMLSLPDWAIKQLEASL